MERRKFLIGAGSLAAGSAAAVGTGAFSSVEADRSVDVDVAGDAEAYLALKADSAYADGTGTQMTLEFDSNGRGDGLNADATTEIRTFAIRNQGTETVRVWIDFSTLDSDLGSNSSVSAYTYDPDTGNAGTPATFSSDDPPGNGGNPGAGVNLAPGEKVGVTMDFDIDGDPGNVDSSITVYAAADDSQRFPNSGPSNGGTDWENSS